MTEGAAVGEGRLERGRLPGRHGRAGEGRREGGRQPGRHGCTGAGHTGWRRRSREPRQGWTPPLGVAAEGKDRG